MKTFRALNKKDERIFNSITKNNWAKTTDINLTQNLPRRYPKLFDKHTGYFDISRNERERISTVRPRDYDIKLLPITDPDSIRIKSSRLRKFGVVRIF